MAAIHLLINNRPHEVDVAPETPLLWVLRDHLNLTGTKYGCGMGLCGSCTVHLGGCRWSSSPLHEFCHPQPALVAQRGIWASRAFASRFLRRDNRALGSPPYSYTEVGFSPLGGGL